jgi:hypothetical protein
MYEQQIKEIYERCDSIKATIKKARCERCAGDGAEREMGENL